jgi:hypothetical protein
VRTRSGRILAPCCCAWLTSGGAVLSIDPQNTPIPNTPHKTDPHKPEEEAARLTSELRAALLGEGRDDDAHPASSGCAAADTATPGPSPAGRPLSKTLDLLERLLAGDGPRATGARAAVVAADGPRALLAAMADPAAAPAAARALLHLLPAASATASANASGSGAGCLWPRFAPARLAALALEPHTSAPRGSSCGCAPPGGSAAAALALGLLRAGLEAAAGCSAPAEAAVWCGPLEQLLRAAAGAGAGGCVGSAARWLGEDPGPASAVELSAVIR